MRQYVDPDRNLWEELCKRPSQDNPIVRERVASILERIKKGSDKALREICLEIDRKVPASFALSKEQIEKACTKVSPEVKGAIQKAAANIEAFHRAQMPKEICVETAPGVKCIQRPVPISRVGLYIPGGTAPLFSTVLMLAIPAKLAGCPLVELCTPAGPSGDISPEVIYAASYCGIEKIFAVGGAQAIAAMAYGTQSIPKVDKIFGPGNQYVTTAKQMVSGSEVSIDMPAGPSEVLVILGRGANPAYAASDLLSQAEHGRDSQVVLLSLDELMAQKVQNEVLNQVESLGRRDLAESSLEKSISVVFSSKDEIIDFANAYAPEHLIILDDEPWSIADRIYAAGSVFVGHLTPESAGDYASGTNHTLPTCGWANSCSGVNMDSFMRKMTLQSLSKEGLDGLSSTIVTMAEAEGLQAHANAVKIRMGK